MGKEQKFTKKRICICGHDYSCHVDLMASITKTKDENKPKIVTIPCLITKCDCNEFKELNTTSGEDGR